MGMLPAGCRTAGLQCYQMSVVVLRPTMLLPAGCGTAGLQYQQHLGGRMIVSLRQSYLKMQANKHKKDDTGTFVSGFVLVFFPNGYLAIHVNTKIQKKVKIEVLKLDKAEL